MESYAIGLIGWGTVGGGVVDILSVLHDELADRCGFSFNLKRLLRVLRAPARAGPGATTLSSDISAIVNDPEIRAVLHLVGGTEAAKDLAIQCLKSGKHVITANKALLAEHWEELYSCAAEHNCVVAFEAAVAGAIPIISSLRDGLVANQLHGIQGILNGTCNYMLTQMEEEGLSYDDALSQAKDLGYAEADPTLDVNGTDTAHKIAILARIASRKAVNFDDVRIDGIENVTAEDIKAAKELGYRIKLLGMYRPGATEDSAAISVEPTLVSLTHQLAGVRMNYNAVRVEGHAAGPNLLVGQGAGALPTASAVLADLVEVATGSYAATANRFKFFGATDSITISCRLRYGWFLPALYHRRHLRNPGRAHQHFELSRREYSLYPSRCSR